MKRVVTCMLSVMLAFYAAPVQALASGFSVNENKTVLDLPQGLAISEIDVSSTGAGVPVSGVIPRISGLADEAFQAELNEAFARLVNEKKAEAEKSRPLEISFSYEVKPYENIVSVLIYTAAASASPSKDVASFNFDPAACEHLDLTDVLGANAVAVVDRYVSDAIRQAPERFTADFKGVDDSVAFYVENDACVVLFDKYAIAAGYLDVVEFPVKISDVKHYAVKKQDYVVLEDYYNLKMIPMRAVCEGLGYTVGWDKAANASTITKENFTTKVQPEKNSYAIGSNPPRELEAAPQIRNGVMYLPVSFYETILGAAYSVDENDTVLFSQYAPK